MSYSFYCTQNQMCVPQCKVNVCSMYLVSITLEFQCRISKFDEILFTPRLCMIGLLLHRGKIAEVIQLLGNFTLMASSKSEGWKFKISGPNVLIRACLKSIPSIFKLTSAPEKKWEDTFIAYMYISSISSHFWKANFEQIISVGRKNRTFFFIFD